MSYEHFQSLVTELCAVLEVPDVAGVLERGCVETGGYEVMLNNYETDASAMYVSLNFGVVPAGRTLRVFRLMLEANLSIYAQDQAQLGMDADSTCIYLIVRVPMTSGVTGDWLAETLQHYFEHGKYWRETIVTSADEMFAGVCSGDYRWIRA